MNAPARIRVTADHIARGERSKGDTCPVALAITEQWDDLPGEVWVGADVIAVRVDGICVWYEVATPPAAYNFIRDFDDGRPVEPFEFDVEWIDQDGVAA